MKKSFTLLEIIFVLTLLSIISFIAFPKLFLNVTNSSYVKIKSDIALIRSAIINNRDENIINGKGEDFIEFLDTASLNKKNEKLFIGVDDSTLLKYAIISTNSEEKEISKWNKITSNHYDIYVSSYESISFTYDNKKGTFTCDETLDSCKELLQ